MVLTDPPAGYTPLIELLVVHVGTFSGEISSDSMGRASTFVPIPFFCVVSTDPGDDVVWFLVRKSGVRGTW